MTEGMRRVRVASSTVRPKNWRKRLPTALVVLGSVAAIGAALTAAVTPVPGLDFLPSGHWVLNTVTGFVVHVDGGSSNVDAQVDVPGAGADSQVVQGPDTGYVVGDDQITVFGKSKLKVEEQIVPPSSETPIAIEAVGGPYAFYPKAGQIVRFGDRAVHIDGKGPFADQVITPDGTVWLYHPDKGNLCALAKDATVVGSCPATLGQGQAGSLTVVGNQAEFLDTTTDVLYPVSDKGLGDGQGVGFQVSDNARLASSDVDGRVAILDPDAHKMSLIDAAQPSRDPITIPLTGSGDYAAPASTGSVVAVVDKNKGTVTTWDGNGQPQGKGALHDGADPRVSKGEDNRIYVENGKGTEVVVVGETGELSTVPAVVTPGADPEKAKPDPGADPEPGTDPGTTPPPDRDTRAVPPPAAPENVPDRTSVQPHNETPTPPEKPDPPVIPASPPGAPPGVSATAGDGSAAVTWGAAANNRAAITGYRLTWNGGSRTVSGTARSSTLSGLTNGTRYTISVAAVNSAGQGPAASAAVTPVAAADAPGNLDVAVSGTAASATWAAPNLGGGTFVGYKVTATGQTAQTVSSPSATFSGLVPGSTVTVTVRAVTKTASGSTLTGAPASKSVAVPSQTVAVRRGGECDSPYKEDGQGQCTKMHVTLTGFQPNTQYLIVPHSDAPTYSNGGSTQETDENGTVTFEAFDYYAVDFELWVTVHKDDKNGPVLASSPRYKWERL